MTADTLVVKKVVQSVLASGVDLLQSCERCNVRRITGSVN